MYDKKTYEMALELINSKIGCIFPHHCTDCLFHENSVYTCVEVATNYVEKYKDRYVYDKINNAPLKTVVMNIHEYNDFVNKTRTKHLEV